MEKKTILNSTVISAYLLMLSTAYLWGFWGHFDINILNYIGVSDIIKSAIWPMIIAIVMYLTQVALNIFNGPKANSTENFSSKTKGEKIDIIIRFSYILLMAAITIGAILYNFITGSKMQRYVSFGWALSTIFYFTTSRNSALMEYIPFKNKSLSYSIICVLPILFLSRGVFEGERIKSGKDTFLIESNSICSSSANNNYRYIDAFADKAFALSLKDHSICIFKYEYLKLIKENQTTNNK
ncbi:hypothetical protein OGX80_11390 [Citrobacter sp. CK194]|uniref:hypothetical protein n=1 Tax=unclassified Citrobacter TaxID=2644389 RepID=UPI0025789FD5|nr:MULTISPECIES: hypothetical protein [unclassified Citrobacter]MDM2972471.1 hypothetical protein [Citrobacter sp. CK198]MDM3025419.1 hypothetical protein [Citrobacter sp. CK194]MDM3031819.1 hypothetical protein [Citrobacter sp. CK186]